MCYFIDRNSLILAEIISASDNGASVNTSDSFSKDLNTFKVESKSVGIHYKQFSGNSFYFKTGLDYNSIQTRYSFSYTSTITPTFQSHVDRIVEGDSISAALSIGNQWQWDNFNIGCDWFGLSLPISSNTNRKSVTTTFTDGYDQAQADADEKDYLKSTQINLLRFYLGASF